ncbi:hypothetical protein FC07_GL002594 [Loigolactobacillus bifermentans DSM 20003]|uniref:Uncharacterized protein n=1 Tax=Loigolactobacillus bifermentans DSM 20003 TaxID=1423726 RepID=A0A0R1HB09_9LACO|nr:hypothetical protein FC07_GL002594 [Loigolactobacillus bifermentans DSM 20003]
MWKSYSDRQSGSAYTKYLSNLQDDLRKPSKLQAKPSPFNVAANYGHQQSNAK